MSDITTLAAKLKAAAEKATPGRIGDRIDGSGSIKYQCVGYDGSLVLQTDHKNMEYGFIGDNGDADEEFFRACVPDVILELVEALEAAERRVAELELGIKAANERYENRTPTEWAYNQACAAIQKHRSRAEAEEDRIAELEARTLAVKLPEKSIYRADEMVKEVGASVFAIPVAVVMDALGEAGIKLQIEE